MSAKSTRYLNIDPQLAARVAANVGVQLAAPANPAPQPKPSPALSQMNLLSGDIRSRKVAILIADGVAESDVSDLRDALRQEGGRQADRPQRFAGAGRNGAELIPEGTWDGLPSVAFDAVFVPGGAASSQAIGADGRGLHYLLEAYKHLKPVAFAGDAQALASQLSLPGDPGGARRHGHRCLPRSGQALMQHRIWQREAATKLLQLPATAAVPGWPARRATDVRRDPGGQLRIEEYLVDFALADRLPSTLDSSSQQAATIIRHRPRSYCARTIGLAEMIGEGVGARLRSLLPLTVVAGEAAVARRRRVSTSASRRRSGSISHRKPARG